MDKRYLNKKSEIGVVWFFTSLQIRNIYFKKCLLLFSGLESTNNDVQQFSPSSLFMESLIGQLCKLIENDPSHQKQLYLSK